MLCDSNSAYLSKFDVYLGKNSSSDGNGLGYIVVDQLTNEIRHLHRHVYFGNFFTSIALVEKLLEQGLYACGTVRPNRQGFPLELRKPRNVKNRGDFAVLQKGSSPLTASVWRDKKLVYHHSTMSRPNDIPQATRCVGANVINLQQPHSVSAYNRFMGGMDLHDQFHVKYDVGRNSKKWWKYLFWFFVNCSLVNAYILVKSSSTRTSKKKRFKQLDFRVELAMELIGGYSR